MGDLLNKAIPVLTKVPLSELSTIFPRIREVPACSLPQWVYGDSLFSWLPSVEWIQPAGLVGEFIVMNGLKLMQKPLVL